MHSDPSSVDAPVAKVGIHRLPFGEITGQRPPAAALAQNVEDRVQDFPQIHFAGTTTGLWLWNQVTEQFKLGVGQVAGISFTHVALSVLCNWYSQLTLSELFYGLTDFSNIL